MIEKQEKTSMFLVLIPFVISVLLLLVIPIVLVLIHSEQKKEIKNENVLKTLVSDTISTGNFESENHKVYSNEDSSYYTR